MRFYFSDGQLWPTQAEAKQGGRKFWPVDVPTDKAGLLEYLNEQLAETAAPVEAQVPTIDVGERPVDQLEAWLQDQATLAEVERIFTSLGTRFH